MMTKVFIVTKSYWEDTIVIGAFSDMQLAEDYIKRREEKDDRYSYYIKSFYLDNE